MFKINRKVEYALIIIKHFYSNKASYNVKEISTQYSLSFDLTAKVLSIMAKKGWFFVKKGTNGGYVMIEDFQKVSLLELIETILGRVSSVNCLTKHLNCSLISQCNLISPMYELNDKIRNFCASISVYKLVVIKKNSVIEKKIKSFGPYTF